MSPIRKEMTIAASQQTAFNVFTENMNAWWPRTHHVGSTPMTKVLVEPGPGGRWYSTHEDGSEVNVGKVLVWNPYSQLVLAWQINGNYRYDTNLLTEVEVNFIEEGTKTTRVTFEHRGLENLSGGSKVIEDMDQGWGLILNLYKRVADEA